VGENDLCNVAVTRYFYVFLAGPAMASIRGAAPSGVHVFRNNK